MPECKLLREPGDPGPNCACVDACALEPPRNASLSYRPPDRCAPGDECERAWAAGLWDGEGNAGTQRSRTGPPGVVYEYLALQMGMCDRQPLDRFAAAVGVGNVTGPYRQDGGPSARARKGSAAWRPIYRWAVQGAKAETVSQLLWPYLSDPKREQIVEHRP